MLKKFTYLTGLMIIIASVIFWGAGCGGGSVSPAPADGDTSFTTHFMTSNSKKIAFQCLETMIQNPTNEFSLTDRAKTDEIIIRTAIDEIMKDDRRVVVDELKVNPFDGKGTLRIYGTITNTAEGRTANVTLTYADWLVKLPQQNLTEYKLNGETQLVTSINVNNAQFDATLNYEGFTLTAVSNPGVLAMIYGSITQIGNLVGNRESNYTVAMDTTTSGIDTTGISGSMKNYSRITMNAVIDENLEKLTGTGILIYSGLDGFAGNVSFDTNTPFSFRVYPLSKKADLIEGKMIIKNSLDEEIEVVVTGVNQISIFFNGAVLYAGSFQEFMGLE